MRQIRTMAFVAVLLAGVWSCGGGDAPTIPLCEDDPNVMCSGECRFEPPSSIDCEQACANVATICNSPMGCVPYCDNIAMDPNECVSDCDATADLRCTNLVFGCYQENTACGPLGECIEPPIIE